MGRMLHWLFVATLATVLAPGLGLVFFRSDVGAGLANPGVCPRLDGDVANFRDCVAPRNGIDAYVKSLVGTPNGMTFAKMPSSTAKVVYSVPDVSSGLVAEYVADQGGVDMVRILNVTGELPCGLDLAKVVWNSEGGSTTPGEHCSQFWGQINGANVTGKLTICYEHVNVGAAVWTGQIRDNVGVLPRCDGTTCKVAIDTNIPATILASKESTYEVGSLWPSVQAWINQIYVPPCTVEPVYTVRYRSSNGGAAGVCSDGGGWSSVNSTAATFERSLVCDYCWLELETTVYSAGGFTVAVIGQGNLMELEVNGPYGGETLINEWTAGCLGGGNGGSMTREFYVPPGQWTIRGKAGKAAMPGPIAVRLVGDLSSIVPGDEDSTVHVSVYSGRVTKIQEVSSYNQFLAPIQGKTLTLNSNSAACLTFLQWEKGNTIMSSPEGVQCIQEEGTVPVTLVCNDPCETKLITSADGILGIFEVSIDRDGQIYNMPFQADVTVARSSSCDPRVHVTLLYDPWPGSCSSAKGWTYFLDTLCWILVVAGAGLLIWAVIAIARSCAPGGSIYVSRKKKQLMRQHQEEEAERLYSTRDSTASDRAARRAAYLRAAKRKNESSDPDIA